MPAEVSPVDVNCRIRKRSPLDHAVPKMTAMNIMEANADVSKRIRKSIGERKGREYHFTPVVSRLPDNRMLFYPLSRRTASP